MASRRTLQFGLVIALATVIAFLALRHSPYLQYVPWMPRRIGVWADANGIVRNTAAFFALGLAVALLISRRWWCFLLLGVFATAIEVAQLWIRGRVFDWLDIAASLGGIALAWLVAWALGRRSASR